MEYIDVLDESGNKTGIIKTRDEVHKHGDWHKSEQLWIMNKNGDILLQKRAPTVKKYPNMWHISTSGHIKSGSNSVQTAIAEAKEELGIDVQEDQLEYLFTSTRKNYIHGDIIDRELHDVFAAVLDISLADLTLQDEEVSDAKFVSLGELKRMVATRDPSMRIPENMDRVIDALEKKVRLMLIKKHIREER